MEILHTLLSPAQMVGGVGMLWQSRAVRAVLLYLEAESLERDGFEHVLGNEHECYLEAPEHGRLMALFDFEGFEWELGLSHFQAVMRVADWREAAGERLRSACLEAA